MHHLTQVKRVQGKDVFEVQAREVAVLTNGLVVSSIALTLDLRKWGTLLGPLVTLMSRWLAG